jgi:hypothetical protein
MPPAEREHTKTGQKVQVSPALGVIEVAPLAPVVEAVETQGLEHPWKLRAHVARMQAKVFPSAALQHL